MKRWMVLGLLACACGSSDSGSPDAGTPAGSGTITGTVKGHALTVKDAVFGIDPGTKFVTVAIADRTGICELLGGSTLPAGTITVLGFAFFNWTGVGGTDPVLGDYAWLDLVHLTGNPAAGRWWSGAFVLPTSCTSGDSTQSTGGTATVTQVGTTGGTHLKVTLTNFAFGSDTLNGSVEAIYCTNATIHPNCGVGVRAVPPELQ
jgi:hypothetical protein